jgi:hypothetical protein
MLARSVANTWPGLGGRRALGVWTQHMSPKASIFLRPSSRPVSLIHGAIPSLPTVVFMWMTAAYFAASGQ